MLTFGFSAYLKLICLNIRPQRTEIRKRLKPSDGGYDFHRSLRLFARRYISENKGIEHLLPSIERIRRAPERNSALAGVMNLIAWRTENNGDYVEFQPVTFHSPNNIFKINFAPDFGLAVNGRSTAIHIWNTKKPALERRFVYGALALLPDAYAELDNRPEDFAILSLRDNSIYCLSDVGNMVPFGTAVAAAIDGVIQRETRDLGLPIPSSIRPPSSPPHTTH